MKLLLTAYLHTSTAVAAAGVGDGEGAEDGNEVEDAASRLQVQVAAVAESACETLLGHNWLLNACSCPRSVPLSSPLSLSLPLSCCVSLSHSFLPALLPSPRVRSAC